MEAETAVTSPPESVEHAPERAAGPALDALNGKRPVVAADAAGSAEEGAGPQVDARAEADAGVEADAAPEADAAGENVLDSAHIEGILESLLLAAGAPVPLARLVGVLDGPGRGEVARALRGLAERFEREARGVRLVQVAGGFQLRSAPQHGPFVRRLLGGKPPRLSRPMLETLAIIAYRQPCTRPEIEAIRGVDCGATINSLLERRLVRIEGRKEAPGRPLLYGSTKEFLEVFGLPDVQALPPLRELGDGAELLTAPDLLLTAGGAHPSGAADLQLQPGTGGMPAAADGNGVGQHAAEVVAAAQPAAAADGPAGDDADELEGALLDPADGPPALDDVPEPFAGDPPVERVGVAASDPSVD